MSSPVRLQRPSNLALDTSKAKSHRVTFKEETSQRHPTPNTTTTTSPRKFRWDSSEYRAKRKRAHSCCYSWDHINCKRRKSPSTIVLPSKFLLGGNITDPLNLEALDKEDAERSNEEANGGGCRRGSTVRVIIPPNINDPLNLDACSEDGDEQLADAISRQRRKRKGRKRRRRNSEPGGMQHDSDGSSNRLCTSFDDSHTPRDFKPLQKSSKFGAVPAKSDPVKVSTAATTIATADASRTTTTTTTTSSTTSTITSATALTPLILRGVSDPGVSSIQQIELPPHPCSTSRHPPAKKTRTKSENKIVSPVIPQPGVERKRHFSHQRHPSTEKHPKISQSHLHPPKNIHPKNSCFQYGNYHQYYGYRNLGQKADPRLKFLDKDWISGKEVLDIGCNIGHITLSVARDFLPQRIIGIDIDGKLVGIARKNVKHYLREGNPEDEFPRSMKLLYGPLRAPVDKEGKRKFPYNVQFCQGNYVMENDALLDTIRPEFDVILCLSVTKWVHLNWGDDGLKRFFRRVFRNLKLGGLFVLEPQAWPSYNKKRKLTKEIFENYTNIRLFPNKFEEFLTSEVGFVLMKKSSTSQHNSKGFDRPIYVYKKPSGKSPSWDTSEEASKIGESSRSLAPTQPSRPAASPSKLDSAATETRLSPVQLSKKIEPGTTKPATVNIPTSGLSKTLTAEMVVPAPTAGTAPLVSTPTAKKTIPIPEDKVTDSTEKTGSVPDESSSVITEQRTVPVLEESISIASTKTVPAVCSVPTTERTVPVLEKNVSNPTECSNLVTKKSVVDLTERTTAVPDGGVADPSTERTVPITEENVCVTTVHVSGESVCNPTTETAAISIPSTARTVPTLDATETTPVQDNSSPVSLVQSSLPLDSGSGATVTTSPSRETETDDGPTT